MKVEKEVISVLATCEVEGNKLVIKSQIDRKMYVKVNTVLTAIGGKWNTKQKAHIFESDIEDILQEIILTGEYSDEKKEYQFFPTPIQLAHDIVMRANIQPGDRCLEPSAGDGNIAIYLPPNTHCIELNDKNRQCLVENGFSVIWDDFMTFKPEHEYDVIVMNPPFCKQQDIKHVTKAIEIAKRTVVAIMSAGVLFRTDNKTKEFRELVSGYGGTIEELPKDAFKKSGTMVNTVLVIINKKINV